MQTKLSQIKTAFEAGDLRGALRIAAKFYDLGDQQDAIKKAHEAYSHADFYRQLGKDPEKLIEEGRLALIARWGFEERCI